MHELHGQNGRDCTDARHYAPYQSCANLKAKLSGVPNLQNFEVLSDEFIRTEVRSTLTTRGGSRPMDSQWQNHTRVVETQMFVCARQGEAVMGARTPI